MKHTASFPSGRPPGAHANVASDLGGVRCGNRH